MSKPVLVRVAGMLFAAVVFLTGLPGANAQGTTTQAKTEGGRVVLVLPFDNRTGQPALGWIGDSFPDTLNQRLNSSGFLTISQEDRRFALDHLGYPPDLRPTRATTIRIADTLDADYVVVGSYTLADQRLQVSARILRMSQLRLGEPIADSAELARLLDVENVIAWKVARQIDPAFPVALQTFLSASAGVKLTAFENYIRGTDASTPQERTKRLQQAVQDSPNYAAALLALGRQQYADREYEQAAATLAKIPRDSRQALEANFYLGLSDFNSAKYAEAESAFAFVASRLPLPEVVNDQGVAQSRQNRDATPLFLRASTADPNDPDYHYNLAVALYQRGDSSAALPELERVLKLRPTDSEALQLKALATAGKVTAGTKPPGNDAFTPAPRLRRTFSEASFRQAAFQLDQMRSLRLSMLPGDKQAAEYTQLGRDYLAQGLLPEAEREFQQAIAADPKGAANAHAGMARVREQSGDLAQARSEAEAALKEAPSAEAHLVLARLDLQQNNLPASAAEVKQALAIEPANGSALGLRQALASRGQSLP